MTYYLGIDFGTSGARAIAIDLREQIVFENTVSFANISDRNCLNIWQETLFSLISSIPIVIREKIEKIAIDGTSATVILCDSDGNHVAEPLLYNDDRGKICFDRMQKIIPSDSLALGASSSLSKLFWYETKGYLNRAKYFLHQADWLAFLLHKQLGISDYHNALKLGYDVEKLCYPDWLQSLSFAALLPQVLTPGSIVGEVDRQICIDYNLNKNCLVCTGTTDSIAAFLASGAHSLGEAVTSLGSTIVIKLLSDRKIDNASYGIYSHRFDNLWLVGGASNTGGAVLKQFFSNEELINYSAKIDPIKDSKLDYYPLVKKGERFPINDPELMPKIDPIPSDRIDFLHGLLQGLTLVETLGYQRLRELGAIPATTVYTAGGGAKNITWQTMRQRYLNCPVKIAKQTEAAYGSALLAKRNCVRV